jgi:hypothetical protein
LFTAAVVGKAAAFAPKHQSVRMVSSALAMAANGEEPVLNKYSRCVSRIQSACRCPR